MSPADLAITEAMTMLAAQPGAIFTGQGVRYEGHALYRHLAGVPMDQRHEFAVTEEFQLGEALGRTIGAITLGHARLVVAIFPRIDFMLRAMDALVNHLDKAEQMSQGQWIPKVLIRTRVGSRTPLDPGPQHSRNHCQALRAMLQTVRVFEIRSAAEVLPVYKMALESKRSSLVVENLSC